ncbi:hypothetical protein N9504_00320 [bacterium]|nr:hypothetical protein [bacterium]
MPFDPNSAKKAGKKSKRGPAQKEGPSWSFFFELNLYTIQCVLF